jgi:hypothetical protein
VKIGKILFATLLLTFLATGVYAYTWDQIDLENTYGSGDNTALLVVDFSDAAGDSFAWAVNFSAATIGYTEILDVVAAADSQFSVVESGGFIDDIIYGSYAGTSGVYWMSNTSSELGETWDGYAGSVGDDGTVGWVNSASWGNPVTPTVPIPGAAWLLGSGLLGLIGIRRQRSSM